MEAKTSQTSPPSANATDSHRMACKKMSAMSPPESVRR
jgi:hypothetical protein